MYTPYLRVGHLLGLTFDIRDGPELDKNPIQESVPSTAENNLPSEYSLAGFLPIFKYLIFKWKYWFSAAMNRKGGGLWR